MQYSALFFFLRLLLLQSTVNISFILLLDFESFMLLFLVLFLFLFSFFGMDSFDSDSNFDSSAAERDTRGETNSISTSW